MCIIIHKPENIILSEETLENCYTRNPDGIGIVRAEAGKLHIFKTLDYDKFLQWYNRHMEENLIIHFRLATHGTVNKRNCHGFKVSDDLAFVHNGVLDVPCIGDKTDSESFGIKILKALPDDFLHSPGITALLEKYITGSKLAFMNAAGEVTILNRKAGIDDKGMWFSNSGYKTFSSRGYGGYGGYGGGYYYGNEKTRTHKGKPICRLCGEPLSHAEIAAKENTCFECLQWQREFNLLD